MLLAVACDPTVRDEPGNSDGAEKFYVVARAGFVGCDLRWHNDATSKRARIDPQRDKATY